MKIRRAALVALVLVATSITGCAYSQTDASSMGCVYNGGPIDSTSYRGYVEPGGGRQYQGIFSEIVDTPVRVIQYSMKIDGTGDIADSIQVKVKGVDQEYQPTLTFTLNTEIVNGKPVACSFIEQHLRPFGATDFNDGVDSNWVTEFLNQRLKPVVEETAIRILQDGDPTALAQNIDGARDEAAALVGTSLTAALEESLGGQYFCKPSYSFGGSAAECGTISVVLPAPAMSAEDAALIAAPQRAKTEADNAIAVAKQQQRTATETADAREAQVDAEQRRSAADKEIAEAQAEQIAVSIESDYAWCKFLSGLGQDCALVKAAEKGDYPDIILGGDSDSTLAIPVPAAPTTTAP